jgi:hypothetical protein
MFLALCLATINAAGWFLRQKLRRHRHQQILDVIVQDYVARGRPQRRANASELPNAAFAAGLSTVRRGSWRQAAT